MPQVFSNNMVNSTLNFVKTNPISALLHLAVIAIGLHLVASNLFALLYVLLYSAPQAFEQLLLVLLPATALVLAAYLPLSTNPINALFCLIFAFFALALLFIAKEVEFLGYLLLIVYVGAIAILFLFVIMLLNVKDLTVSVFTTKLSTRYLTVMILPVVLLKLVTTLRSSLFIFLVENDLVPTATTLPSSDQIVAASTTQFLDLLVFSQLLYTQHSPLFILAALLLLTAMLGAIVLATNTTDQGQ